MAAPTVIGTNTWACRLSDVATDATDPGIWAWYFNGEVSETWDMGLIGNYNTGRDLSGVTTFGQFKWMAVIKDVTIKTKAVMDTVKRAFRYWNDNDIDLYFQNELDTADEGYWAKSDWSAADEKIRVRIAKISWKKLMSDARVCDIILLRVTDV